MDSATLCYTVESMRACDDAGDGTLCFATTNLEHAAKQFNEIWQQKQCGWWRTQMVNLVAWDGSGDIVAWVRWNSDGGWDVQQLVDNPQCDETWGGHRCTLPLGHYGAHRCEYRDGPSLMTRSFAGG